MTSIARRPTLPAMPITMAGSSSYHHAAPYSPVDHMPCSPLDQLGIAMRRDTLPSLDKDDMPVTPTTTIPTLDFKLFRSSSIYSVESGDSISVESSEDEGYSTPYGFGFTSEPECDESEEKPQFQPEPQTPVDDDSHVITFSTPSTPRARRVANGVTSAAASNNASPADSGAATPTARTKDAPQQHGLIGTSASPTLAHAPAKLRSAVSEAPFTLRPAPIRTARSASASNPSSPSSASMPRSASEPVPPVLEPNATQQPVSPRFPETAAAPYCESVHGEQGSDWGEDENDFEWLDAADVPEASTLNTSDGLQGRNAALSPTRRLSHRLSVSRLRTAIPALGGATPKADATSTSSASPIAEEHIITPSGTENEGAAAPAPGRRRTFKKKRSYHIPRRAAPPPPPGAGFVAPPEFVATRSRSPGKPRTSSSGSGAADRSSPSPDLASDDSGAAVVPEAMPPVVVITATPPRQRQRLAVPHGAGGKELPRDASLAYSFYDLDATPKNGRVASDTFPRGRYARVPLHELNGASPQRTTPGVPTSAGPPKVVSPARRTSAGDVTSVTERTHAPVPAHVTRHLSRAPTMSEANRMRPDELVNAGIARRDAGDLPKSAWLFMKASEAGNVGGQIHYGINLRYGLGIARDERRAFTELSAACERGLATGAVDLRAAAGTLLSPELAQSMPPHLATGLLELGTCYLDGIGCKRQPELALEHLRMAGSLGDLAAQEQLGQLLSKGAHHVKKDMREAAKWYRAAIGNGSSIPGLAWVWKDKYSTD